MTQDQLTALIVIAVVWAGVLGIMCYETWKARQALARMRGNRK